MADTKKAEQAGAPAPDAEPKQDTKAARAEIEARGYRTEERNGAQYHIANDGRYESSDESYVQEHVRHERARAADRAALGLA